MLDMSLWDGDTEDIAVETDNSAAGRFYRHAPETTVAVRSAWVCISELPGGTAEYQIHLKLKQIEYLRACCNPSSSPRSNTLG